MLASLIRAFFKKENIEYFASCPLSSLRIVSPRRVPSNVCGATLFLIPYDLGETGGNVSRYAVPRDYHAYIRDFSERLARFLSENGCADKTYCAADTSPIAEHDAAILLGLGFRGKNHLVINEKYGSYIFIGAVFTEQVLSLRGGEKTERNACIGCGKCLAACPSGSLESGDFTNCLSGLSQSKRLTEEQEKAVAGHMLCWGCDVCQEVCPHNRGVAPTPIEFFRTERTPLLTETVLREMPDEEFLRRAYSWRGRAVLERNLRLQNALCNSIPKNREKINTGEKV